MRILRRPLCLLALLSACQLGTSMAAPAETESVQAILKPRLALVRGMVDRSASGEHGAVIDLQAMVEEQPFVTRGQRKEARKLNAQGLALLGKDQYGPAVDTLHAARAADRADAEIANNLGYAYYKAGRLPEAEQALLETLAIAPARAAAWGNLGDLYASQGNQLQAMGAYRNAYRFSRAPAKTIAYFEQQQQKDANPKVQQALAAVLPLLTGSKASNDGDRNAVVNRRIQEPDAPPPAQPSASQAFALSKAARSGDQNALKQLRQFADQGQPAAQYLIGFIYERGESVTADPELAYSWFKRAAEQNFPPALHAQALLLNRGHGITRNDAEAMRIYRRAADANYAPSQNNLGVMFYRGEGVEANPEEALIWFKQAAENGSPTAQLNLGRMYESGRGTPVILEQALRWYLRAAEQGKLATAQYKVGVALENGRGTAKDVPQAIEWYRKAAEQGVEPARDALKRLGALE